MKKYLLIIFILEMYANIINASLPVDLTFLIADLKYNEEQGVKICEIQPGSVSVFSGYDFLTGNDGFVPNIFNDFLSKYNWPMWYIPKDICDSKFKKKFSNSRWKKALHLDEILRDDDFIAAASNPVKDPYKIADYHGLVYVNPKRFKSISDFIQKYPGIIFLDASLVPYAQDKYLMNQLLSLGEPSKNLKPQWNLYPKLYSKELVQTILQDIPSEILVIKPRNASKGKGILIIHRDDLNTTLEIISSKSHANSNDPAYAFWKKSNLKNFIVEEFIESDPIAVPHLGNQLYDGTLRLVFWVSFDQGLINMEFVEGHWKLPKKSLTEPGTLTDKHKSYGNEPHFMTVDPRTMKKIKAELRETFPLTYQKMLKRIKIESRSF